MSISFGEAFMGSVGVKNKRAHLGDRGECARIAARCCRTIKSSAAATGGSERARRQGGGSQTAREAVQPQDRRGDRGEGRESLVHAGVRRVRADLGGGVPG